MRRVRHPAAEKPADGLEEQVAVRAEPPAEDDERDVGDGRDRRQVQRDPAGHLLDHLAGHPVSPTRFREDRARVVRRGEAPRRAETLRERRHARRGRIELGVQADQREVDLAGGAVVTAMEFAPQDDPRPHPGADREEREVVDAARDTAPLLAERGEVDVVLQRDRKPEPLLELGVEGSTLEAGNVLRQVDPPRLRLDDAGDSDDHAVDQVLRQRRRLDERGSKRRDRLDRGLGVRGQELDVLTRADLAGEIAGRAAQEVRAEVEAEHEGRVRCWLEVHRAVRGPAGIV